MAKPYSKNRLAAGLVPKDKFSAADQAMSAGVLSAAQPASTVEDPVVKQPTLAASSPTKEKVLLGNGGFVKGARVTRKTPKGESVIIRETFSLPPSESSRIDALRMRAAQAGVMLNRSEIVRAGIAALASLEDEAFAEIANNVPKLKTGRPTGSSN